MTFDEQLKVKNIFCCIKGLLNRQNTNILLRIFPRQYKKWKALAFEFPLFSFEFPHTTKLESIPTTG